MPKICTTKTPPGWTDWQPSTLSFNNPCGGCGRYPVALLQGEIPCPGVWQLQAELDPLHVPHRALGGLLGLHRLQEACDLLRATYWGRRPPRFFQKKLGCLLPSGDCPQQTPPGSIFPQLVPTNYLKMALSKGGCFPLAPPKDDPPPTGVESATPHARPAFLPIAPPGGSASGASKIKADHQRGRKVGKRWPVKGWTKRLGNGNNMDQHKTVSQTNNQ